MRTVTALWTGFGGRLRRIVLRCFGALGTGDVILRINAQGAVSVFIGGLDLPPMWSAQMVHRAQGAVLELYAYWRTPEDRKQCEDLVAFADSRGWLTVRVTPVRKKELEP